MAASARFDYVLIDLQHSVFGLETIADMCDVARAAGIAALIRPGVVSQDTVNQLVDLGADGLMLHDVASRQRLEESARQLRYPPDGARASVGGPASDYRHGPVDASLRPPAIVTSSLPRSRARNVSMTSTRSSSAARPTSSTSAGRTSRSRSVDSATWNIRRSRPPSTGSSTCRRNDVPIAMAAGSPREARRLVERGVQMITWRNDKAILLDSYRTFTSGNSAGRPASTAC